MLTSTSPISFSSPARPATARDSPVQNWSEQLFAGEGAGSFVLDQRVPCLLWTFLSFLFFFLSFVRCQLDWDEFMLRIPSYTPSTKRARSAKGSGSNASKQSATSERKSLAPAAAAVAPVDGNTAAMTDTTATAVADAGVATPAPRSSSRRKLLASVGDSSEMSDRAVAEQSGNGGVAPSEPAATRTPAKRSSPSADNYGPAAPANGDDKENAAVARGGGSNRQQQPAADGDGFGSAHKRHRPSRTAAAVDAAPLTGSWARRGGAHDTPPSPPSEQAAQVAAAPGPIAMPPQDTTNKTGRVTRKHK